VLLDGRGSPYAATGQSLGHPSGTLVAAMSADGAYGSRLKPSRRFIYGSNLAAAKLGSAAPLGQRQGQD